MEKQYKKKIYWFIKNNGIYTVMAVLSLILTAGLVRVIPSFSHQNNPSTVLDLTVFFSITAALLLQAVANIVSRKLLKRYEDSAKLTPNYVELVKRYASENQVVPFLKYDNYFAFDDNIKAIHRKTKRDNIDCVFPVTEDIKWNNCNIQVVDNKEKQYCLPDDVKEHMTQLFDSHVSSNVYNQLNIRVDGWKRYGDTIYIYTSRTTYFDSLITNRSVDYIWNNGMTTRDVYQYGPYIPELETSVLSNHLGFNGFIQSADGYIPFVKRSNYVSIGKYSYGDSIGASMKVKYALNEKQELTKEGIIQSIYKEIKDELKIEQSDLFKFMIEENLICAYRDMVEGGKPQLLFYLKSYSTKKEIEDRFARALKKNKKIKRKHKWDKELKELEDGEKFMWIHKDELENIAIVPEGLAYRGKYYEMMPSASGAVVMLINWMREGGTHDE